jgi:hypothetical protein
MSLNILEVESNYEDVTYIGYNFRVRKYVYPYFIQKGYNVLTLFGNDATRQKFAQYCLLPDVYFISAFGHGYDDLFTGQHGEILWKACSYDPREAQGKIIHLMSCLTARQLGPDLIDKGGRAYFGYEESFVFMHTLGVSDPLNDSIADVFFQCDSEIDRLIADGLAAGEVYDGAKALFRDKQEYYLAIDSDVAMTLLQDHDALKIFGDLEALLPKGDGIIELSLDTAVSNSLSKPGDNRMYILKGVKARSKLTFTLTGPADADFDLYIRKGQIPELRKFDYRGYTDSSNEEITIDSTDVGDYYAMVHSYRGMGVFSLKASMPRVPEGEEIRVGEVVTGTLVTQRESKKYLLKGVPAGEELQVTLDGPDGADFDVYVKFGSPATTEDYDLRGYTGLPDENVVVYPTKGGDYYITVCSYKGTGQYTLKTSL